MIESIQNIGNHSLILLICWLIFLGFTIFSYFKFQKFTSLLLFFSAFFLAAAFAMFAPYFFAWDEQFHALVGKNLAENPFVPKLFRNEFLHLDPENWVNAQVWLHKQPLFTWQMALSIKIFGNNVFAVRFPSVLFHGLLVAAIFRMGSLIFNRKTGFLAALIAMHSSFLLGLLSGRIGTDHNDFIFLCYITFSFWAWFEFQNSQKQKWLIWIGVFAGCAVLTKWLVGLLVFGAWGFVLLQQLKQEYFWQKTIYFVKALGISCLVFIPWQIYTFIKFPTEAAYEMAYNAKHATEVIEKHQGSAWFHYEQIQTVYFHQTEFFIFLLVGIVALFLAKISKKNILFMLSSLILVYGFFTYVPTKMPAFTIPVFSFVALIIAFGLTHFSSLIKINWVRRLTLTLFALLILNWMFKPSPTLTAYGFKNDTMEQAGRITRIEAQNFIAKNGQNNPKRIVFGINDFEYANISWMFFHNEIAYPFIPADEDLKKLQKMGFQTVIFKSKKDF
jgi:4-amino-4-deoxy-L-arabinose transferase-like glycosyltransferase